MDFFKSVFSADLDPPSADEHDDEPEEETATGEAGGSPTGAGPDPSSSGDVDAESSGGGGGGGGVPWGGFAGLIKTLASKSESVIQTYRRDLEEFGSGLRKETAAIREAIRDLPTSLDSGASVAQESLESVGQAIDDLGGSVWRGTADLIAQGKDALLDMDADASADLIGSPLDAPPQSAGAGGASNRYNRFEAKVMAVQSDPATFTEEPEDAEDFLVWTTGFQLAEKEVEIESLLAENKAVEGNHSRLVPNVVDREIFWSRYFYRVHKLKQAEDVRVNLVKRAISREEEEDLSWEVDDDDTEKDRTEEPRGHEEGEEQKGDQGRGEESGVSVSKESVDEKKDPVKEEDSVKNSQLETVAEIAFASSANDVRSEIKEEDHSEDNNREAALKVDDKVPPEVREPVESCKDSDMSIISSQPSIPEEDDLEWDEIEDLGDTDEKKVGVSAGSPHKINLHKKLSAAEEDEDLSWDIEDDEPVKP